MKKKLTILLSLLMVVSAVLMTSCSKDPTPTDVVDQFLKAYKQQDFDAAKTVYSGDDELFEAIDILNEEDAEESEGEGAEAFTKVYTETILPKLLDFDYTLGEEKIAEDEKTATVKVSVTTYKIGDAVSNALTDVFTKMLTSLFTGNEMTDDQTFKLMASDMSTEFDKLEEKDYTGEAIFKLTKTEDGWKVDKIDTEGDIYNTLTGGMVHSVDELNDMFGE